GAGEGVREGQRQPTVLDVLALRQRDWPGVAWRVVRVSGVIDDQGGAGRGVDLIAEVMRRRREGAADLGRGTQANLRGGTGLAGADGGDRPVGRRLRQLAA